MKQTMKNKLKNYAGAALTSAVMATGVASFGAGLEFMMTFASLEEVRALNGTAAANNTAGFIIDDTRSNPILKYGNRLGAEHYLRCTQNLIENGYGGNPADYYQFY